MYNNNKIKEIFNNFNSIPKFKINENTKYNSFFRYNFIDGIWINSIAIHENKLITSSNHFIDLINQDTNLQQ